MTYGIIALLAALGAWALWFSLRRAKRGGGCCGEHGQAETKVAAADRNKAHYSYQLTLTVGGMTCENCARKVENALNSLEGVWARVRVDQGTALVRCKQPPDEQALRRAVGQAGYVVTGMQRKGES